MAGKIQKESRIPPWKQRGVDEEESGEEEDDASSVEEEEEGEGEAGTGMSGRELAELQQKASTLPLTKLTELKKKLGAELFNKVMYAGSHSSPAGGQTDGGGRREEPVKRSAKRPREESSTKRPRKLRPIECARPKAATRFDPRFSTNCGDFDEVAFHRDYAFLEGMREKDMKELKRAHKQARREQDPDLAQRIKTNLLRLQNQQKASKEKRRMEQVRAELRQTNIERMNRGEHPIYLNNHEMKERFRERRGEGGDQLMAKTTNEQKEQKDELEQEKGEREAKETEERGGGRSTGRRVTERK